MRLVTSEFEILANDLSVLKHSFRKGKSGIGGALEWEPSLSTFSSVHRSRNWPLKHVSQLHFQIHYPVETVFNERCYKKRSV